MKKFLDRIAFLFHRPCFHGKTYTSIVMQGIHRGGNVVGYLDFVGRGLGFNVVTGSSIKSLEPMAQKDQRKMDRTLARQSERFREQLLKPAYPEPSIFKLLFFRMRRTSVHLNHGENHRDHSYYRDRGWFESDYFYLVELGSFKKALASTFDLVAALLYKH